VYVWIWRHLPGGLPGRLLGSLVLLAAAVLLLFAVVFPRVEPLLPFSSVTVDGPATPGPASSSSPTPSP
jgi:hypothetical protein